jgi:hypothetical protein
MDRLIFSPKEREALVNYSIEAVKSLMELFKASTELVKVLTEIAKPAVGVAKAAAEEELEKKSRKVRATV